MVEGSGGVEWWCGVMVWSDGVRWKHGRRDCGGGDSITFIQNLYIMRVGAFQCLMLL